MKCRKIFLALVVIALATLTACGPSDEEKSEKEINKALEMSMTLKSGSIETEILEGSYYPKEAPLRIETNFNIDEPKKDKALRNIAFDAAYTYKDHNKEVKNMTNYEGLYLNVYYPYDKYNRVNAENVESATINKLENGTEYYVYYKDTHLSRRMEWEYCQVEKDYEYFFINQDGVITEYASDTTFKQQDKKTNNWIDGESKLSVKLTDYTLI